MGEELRITGIPKPGVPVTVEELKVLAEYFGKADVFQALFTDPIDDVFVSDGCSIWPDNWFGKDIYPACFWHDVRYWLGIPGDDLGRLKADMELMLDVTIITGSSNLARAMATGIWLGGSEKLDTPWHWGFGRK